MHWAGAVSHLKSSGALFGLSVIWVSEFQRVTFEAALPLSSTILEGTIEEPIAQDKSWAGSRFIAFEATTAPAVSNADNFPLSFCNEYKRITLSLSMFSTPYREAACAPPVCENGNQYSVHSSVL